MSSGSGKHVFICDKHVIFVEQMINIVCFILVSPKKIAVHVMCRCFDRDKNKGTWFVDNNFPAIFHLVPNNILCDNCRTQPECLSVKA